MTLSRMPSYARQRSYETGRRASGLIRKFLMCLRNLIQCAVGNPQRLEYRCLQSRGLIARSRTIVSVPSLMMMVSAMTFGSRFWSDRRGNEAHIEGLARASSAFEHLGRAIAAPACGSKWHSVSGARASARGSLCREEETCPPTGATWFRRLYVTLSRSLSR